MSAGKHAAGPWHVGGILGRRPIIYAADGYAVADAMTHHGSHVDQADANARLIAAAPDLLAAAKNIEQWWLDIGMSEFGGAPHAIFAIRAAIAKAEGR